MVGPKYVIEMRYVDQYEYAEVWVHVSLFIELDKWRLGGLRPFDRFIVLI